MDEETEDTCPHCSPTHGDPNSCSWGVYIGPERDGDRQPTTLHVMKSDGAHVAETDVEWLRGLLHPQPPQAGADLTEATFAAVKALAAAARGERGDLCWTDRSDGQIVSLEGTTEAVARVAVTAAARVLTARHAAEVDAAYQQGKDDLTEAANASGSLHAWCRADKAREVDAAEQRGREQAARTVEADDRDTAGTWHRQHFANVARGATPPGFARQLVREQIHAATQTQDGGQEAAARATTTAPSWPAVRDADLLAEPTTTAQYAALAAEKPIPADEFAEFDVTEEEFDARAAAGEPVTLMTEAEWCDYRAAVTSCRGDDRGADKHLAGVAEGRCTAARLIREYATAQSEQLILDQDALDMLAVAARIASGPFSETPERAEQVNARLRAAQLPSLGASEDLVSLAARYIHWSSHRRAKCQCDPDEDNLEHGRRLIAALDLPARDARVHADERNRICAAILDDLALMESRAAGDSIALMYVRGARHAVRVATRQAGDGA